MKWTLWLGLTVLVLTILVLLTRPKKSCYAPPRDENTVLPFVEKLSEEPAQESQTEVFKDAAGWLNMREHPLTGYFQEDAFANVYAGVESFYGDFVGLESSAGIAPMTVIPSSESNVVVVTDYLPSTTSRNIPFIGAEM